MQVSSGIETTLEKLVEILNYFKLVSLEPRGRQTCAFPISFQKRVKGAQHILMLKCCFKAPRIKRKGATDGML